MPITDGDAVKAINPTSISRTLTDLGYINASLEWKHGDVEAVYHDETDEHAVAVVLSGPPDADATSLIGRIDGKRAEVNAVKVLIFSSSSTPRDTLDVLDAYDFQVQSERFPIDQETTEFAAVPPQVRDAEPTGSTREIIELLRKNLLDLSNQNPLLSYSTGKTTIRVIRETPNALYRHLVVKQLVMQLDADVDTPKGGALSHELARSSDIQLPEYHDDRIQTSLTPKQFQAVASNAHDESARIMRTTGTNQLYLALGFLNWYDAPSSEIRFQAPLVLIPIGLSRTKKLIQERKLPGDSDFNPDDQGPQYRKVPRYVYDARWTGDDIRTNCALELRVERMGQPVPNLEPYLPTGDIEKYLADVQAWAAGNPIDKRWTVDNHGIIGLFDFTQAWVYQDLGDEAWDADDSSAIRALFGGGSMESLPPLPDAEIERSEAEIVSRQLGWPLSDN